MSNVCVRFRKNAQDIFITKYKRKVEVKDTLGQPDEFEAILRNFGTSIHVLEIFSGLHGINDFNTLQMVNQHTTALKSLVLCNFVFTDNMISIRSLFEKLHTLELIGCNLKNGGRKVLSACTELNVLRMSESDWADNCIGIAFPKLEEICLLTPYTRALKIELEKFITSYPALKRFKFGYRATYCCKAIDLIFDHLQNLGQVKIGHIFRHRYAQKDQFEKCIQRLSQCAKVLSRSSLKMLTLPPDDFTVLLLNELAEIELPIECLSLNCVDIANAFESCERFCDSGFLIGWDFSNNYINELVKKMPQLEELHLINFLSTPINTTEIRKMIEDSKSLSYLVVANNSQIEMDDCQTILKAIQNRPEKIPLTICLGYKKKLDVSTEFLLENREWLRFISSSECDNDND